ncbi:MULTISPECIES: TonB-dependent receptor [unclassified Pseudomonas]|uniref:TonB-dependent receptor n=2 Tax=Pseudomonas TaxID=286 RepID=UPI0008395E2F|nr:MULTISPECIES: TonB-dependent receptor [unclassified Pseudomonas]QIH09771.1 TonB-dependent receptor [Pseudomonas sp. BIOMIG1BAC]
MKYLYRSPSCAALCCALSFNALAEGTLELPQMRISADEQKKFGLQLDTQGTTGSRLGLTPRQTPASISVVERQQIEQRGAATTQDVLLGMPGMNAASSPGIPGFVSYRGFSGPQITQLFNGISVQYDSIAARPVDSWIYDRVEAVGGPSSFLYGAGAVGGSINYITKLASRSESFNEGRISYGSYDSRDLSLGFNHALNAGPGPRHYARLDFNHSTSNGYIDREQRDAWTLAFSLLTDINDQLSHTLAFEYQDERVDSPYWGTPALAPLEGKMQVQRSRRFENYNVEDGRYEQRVRWLRSIIDYQVDDATSLRNTLYHYNADREYRNVENYAYNADNSQVIRSGILLQRHAQELNGNRFELLHQNNVFGLDSQWSAGIDYSHNVMSNYPLSLPDPVDKVDPDRFEPGSFWKLPGVRRSFDKNRRNQVDTWALFLENRLQLSERLSLLSGLRHDQIDLEVTNYRAVNAANPAFFQRKYRPTTGRLGLVYELTPTANVYVQYSTAADPPSGVLTTASYGQVRDFDLSTGNQWEIGSKFDFLEGRGSATLAAYRIERKNLSTADPANPGNSQPVGQQSSRGVELAASLRVTPKLLAEGNFAYVDAQYDEFYENVGGRPVSRKGNRPTNIPEKVANLWLTYDLAPSWQVGADSRYVSSMYANAANTRYAPGYAIFGAFVGYRVDADTRVTARVRNLTDRVYARSTAPTQLYLGAPRTFELALQTRF